MPFVFLERSLKTANSGSFNSFKMTKKTLTAPLSKNRFFEAF